MRYLQSRQAATTTTTMTATMKTVRNCVTNSNIRYEAYKEMKFNYTYILHIFIDIVWAKAI